MRKPTSPYIGVGVTDAFWVPLKPFYSRTVVLEAVTQVTGYTGTQLREHVRNGPIDRARNSLYFYLHLVSNMGLAEIGRFLKRNHASVKNGKEKFEKHLKREDPRVVVLARDIAKTIENIQSYKNHSPHDSSTNTKRPGQGTSDGA